MKINTTVKWCLYMFKILSDNTVHIFVYDRNATHM